MENNKTVLSSGIRLSQTSFRYWKDLVDADRRFDAQSLMSQTMKCFRL